MKEKLNDYKLNNLNKKDLIYYLAFDDIYNIEENATDEEIIAITELCMKTSLIDEENYSITKFTSFVAEKYFDKELTLEKIRKLNPRNVLIGVEDDYLYYVNPNHNELER